LKVPRQCPLVLEADVDWRKGKAFVNESFEIMGRGKNSGGIFAHFI
jgi:hypothetical protein